MTLVPIVRRVLGDGPFAEIGEPALAVLTHRLIPVDDSQHAVVLIDMLNQFTHGGTMSAPTDNAAAA
ncbi:hypothetical protein [Streptomyces laculatispora]|uniref:hypothetical protein n=1 Tax=Streptomyces laculatispora TaxID=887464 RepID=UPI001A950FFB|nr:hypothetical protein [Streptomyces laculatispora]MBO0913621.1 hypothetical protein [Streptomyces laculatispora]